MLIMYLLSSSYFFQCRICDLVFANSSIGVKHCKEKHEFETTAQEMEIEDQGEVEYLRENKLSLSKASEEKAAPENEEPQVFAEESASLDTRSGH